MRPPPDEGEDGRHERRRLARARRAPEQERQLHVWLHVLSIRYICIYAYIYIYIYMYIYMYYVM